MIDATCEKVEIQSIKIPIRIDDRDLKYNNKEPIFRDPDVKNGECLFHISQPQFKYLDPPPPVIYNSAGYSSAEWGAAFPKIESPSNFDYFVSCKDLNDSLTREYNELYNAYYKVFVGIKYKQCSNKYDQIDNNNTDGCYTFRYEDQEVRTPYACQYYKCEETDQVDGEFGVDTANYYSCRVQCSRFNAPSSWDYRLNAYVCNRPPDPLPTGCGLSEKESWDCLNKEVTSSVNNLNSNSGSILDRIYNLLFSFFSNKESDSETDSGSDSNIDTSQLDDIKLESNHHTFSFSDFLKDLFPSNVSCPAQNSINILGSQYNFSYSALCDVLKYLGNIVMIFSIIISYRTLRSV
ncbi:neisseria meningitidis TspB family protein [Acinetobacter sp. 1294596]|uniref:virulence factor TspB C-terminal domain-related protein n=1 Tax=Acinetobacter sp. 1294596 TaxID=1310603 RepID=UPI0004518A29|nr:virulence factor TspB C-terminal domain-related protein [Acinetobacter sp. 1294596]EXF55953.1 neisseria meningitidis TspB family protein [Acinetobacter sp. 1294596]